MNKTIQTTPRGAKTASAGERGQSLVEFTLMAILLGVLLLGILDMGRAYFTYLALQDAAGEGASYGSVYPTHITGGDPNNITYRVRHAAPTGLLVDLANANVNVETSGSTPGSHITVTVSADYRILTPFVGTLVGGQTITLSAKSVAVITTGN